MKSKPIEISDRLTRLKPVTEAPAEKVRYYVPKALQKDAERLRRRLEIKLVENLISYGRRYKRTG